MHEFFFSSFFGTYRNLRKALFVYRLIGATLIGNFFDDPFFIKIKILALRRIYDTKRIQGLILLITLLMFNWYLRFLFLKFSIEAVLLVMSVILWEAWVVPKYRN